MNKTFTKFKYMSHYQPIDELHNRVTDNRWLQIFTAATRGLLGVGFIIPGLIKLFSPIPFGGFIPDDTLIGAFFDAFFQAQELYLFVGIVQVLAGVLLFFPSTVTLGAVMYFPVILTICAITIGFSFQGTWIVTSLMVLANLYLLCWEYDRLKALLPGVSSPLEFRTQKNLGFWATMVYGGLLGFLGLGSFMLAVNIHQNASLWVPIGLLIITLLSGSYLINRYDKWFAR